MSLSVRGLGSVVTVSRCCVKPTFAGAGRGAMKSFAAAASETQKQGGLTAIRMRFT